MFVVLALDGSALTALVSLKLPETLPGHERNGGGVGEAPRGMRTLLVDRVFTDVDDRGAGAPEPEPELKPGAGVVPAAALADPQPASWASAESVRYRSTP
ncbi:hypothetical protein [Streptomyces iakyrus]|uniref:hypothetical protein n=1 Tax=Streptomyces iakyrus TaxID=68219 RepID=UPI003D8A0F1B